MLVNGTVADKQLRLTTFLGCRDHKKSEEVVLEVPGQVIKS
jgi:hypothetical protein